MNKIKNEDVSELEEKLVGIIKGIIHKCEHGNCLNCKFVGMSNCDYRQIVDEILNDFMVLEKYNFGSTDDIKQRLNSIYGKSSIERMPKQITDVILAEDGSVDEDELKKQFGDNVPIVIYRQGAAKPEIQHLEEPIAVVCENEGSQKDEPNKEHELLKKIIEDCSLTFGCSPEYDGTNCKIDSEIILSDDEVKIINSLYKEQLEGATHE